MVSLHFLTLSALAALAIAVPSAAPPTKLSKTFELRLRLVDKKQDLPAGMDNARVVIDTITDSDKYYRLVAVTGGHTRTYNLNGTKAEVANGKGTILDNQDQDLGNAFLGKDGQAGSRPLYISTVASKITQEAVALSPSSDPYSYLLPKTNYVVCNNDTASLAVRAAQRPTISYPLRNLNPNGKVPKDCVPVRIYPLCSDGAATHPFAQPARCYPANGLP